ncbi:hypothetical protein QZH41_003116 [Actinostola sp. cb2023]|nr:hypothetical protein QZH41_003116 [Actinostola sp. cb2023]
MYITNLGTTHAVEHKIQTGDAMPIRQHPRRTSPWKREEIHRQVDELLQQGRVSESSSPWSSPVVLVAKKDGSQRLCIDYRLLNAVTVKDAYPLPRVDDSIDALSGSKWFSTLDLASGSFERLMELVLKGLHWKICLIYLDDVIVMSRTVEEGMDRLEQVFARLATAGLKLKPKKCSLFQKEVSFLGHVVTEDGVATDPAKVEQVLTWPVPENVTEVRSFLGLVSYYRRFIPGFSDTAHPLHRLTEAKTDFQWTPQCQLAFDELKNLLTSAPVLAYPTRYDEFVLDTDASDHGIGAVLSQIQDGVEKPIAFASRTLSKSERNYCVTRRELLAIFEFVKHHRHYLQGTKFHIRTDHAPLRSVLKAKEPEGQLARWIEYLSTFEFDIHHREGKKHQNADALSRRPCNERCKWCKGWRFHGQVSFSHVGVQTECQETKQTGTKTSDVSDECGRDKVATVKLDPTWTAAYLQSQQQNDDDLKVIIQFKKSTTDRPPWVDVSPQSSAVKALWSQWNRLYFKDGVLFRRWENDDGTQIINQLILPKSLRETALTAHHNHTTASHLGIRKTMCSLRSRYYWPGLTSVVYKWVARCHDCGAKKSFGKKRRAPLKQYMVGAPMERLAIDVMGPLTETPRKNKYVLVVTDYFTKWTESYPIPNQEAPTVAEKLVGEFICRFGVPRQLHSDQEGLELSHISCRRCRQPYIGEITRSLRERFDEHLRSTRKQTAGFIVTKHFATDAIVHEAETIPKIIPTPESGIPTTSPGPVRLVPIPAADP